MTHPKQNERHNDTKRLLVHEWWDKVAYGLIIGFAIMIYNSTQTSAAEIQELRTDVHSFRAEVQTTLEYHSLRITKMEMQMEEFRREINQRAR